VPVVNGLIVINKYWNIFFFKVLSNNKNKNKNKTIH